MKSFGMVLCASNKDKTKIELIRPPEGSRVGERIFIEKPFGENCITIVDARKKNSAWDKIKNKLATDEHKLACFDGRPMKTMAGPCFAYSLSNSFIS